MEQRGCSSATRWILRPCVRDYGNIVALSPDRIFLLNHPDDIKHVLQDNHRNYCKGPTMTRMLKPFFGQGLITSEGEQWLRQRRLAQPAFNRRHSPEMLKLMVETTAAMLARWEATAGQSREHREELTQLTLQILLKGVLGTDWGKDPDALLHAVLELEGALSLASSVPRCPCHSGSRRGGTARPGERCARSTIGYTN